MANNLLKAALPLTVLAFLYQAIISDLIFVTVGVGRTVQTIDAFPYQCHRIEDPRLSACEDMWLSDATRQLFLACSEPQVRNQWMPNIGRFNVSGRSRSDAIIALDIDKPIVSTDTAKQHIFTYRVLQLLNFPNHPPSSLNNVNTNVDNHLQLVGLTGSDSPDQTNLYLINNRPSIDHVTGTYTDCTVTGANSTIEHFITGPAATAMKHIHTYMGKGITTPNNIALIPGRKGFFITNDHGSSKTGIWHSLSPYIGTGDVTYCDTSSSLDTDGPKCTKLAGGLRFPNGLLYHPVHDLLYVPSAAVGNIHVYKPMFKTSRSEASTSRSNLLKVSVIKIPYPMDNLSLDAYTGDIYAAAFPKTLEVMKGFDDGSGRTKAASAAIRVRKVDGRMEWVWEKVVEDRDGEVLPVSTTVVRDGKTGRLFLSGVYSPFITVCEPT